MNERRNQKSWVVLAVLSVLIGTGSAWAGELHVPSEYGTIQAAIDAAVNGDTVIVADGVYTGFGNRDIDFCGLAITVRSENGPNNCIVDCNGTETETHHGFYFHNSEGTNSVLDGFTVTNGYAYHGGGIRCEASSPTIRNCVLTKNTATAGGGFYCGHSVSNIIGCTITGNVAREGGGMCAYECLEQFTLMNCVFYGNSARYAGGMDNCDSYTALVNCTFSKNTATHSVGGIGNGQPTLTNCILWNNTSPQIDVYRPLTTITYSNIQGGWSGEGNIDADPLFVNADGNDFHLLPTSPCIDAGMDAGVYTDIEGNVRAYDYPGVDNNGELPEFDIGAYEAFESLVLVGLEIVGPNEVAEDFQAQYSAIAHYDIGSPKDVTDLADWSVEPNDIASIDAGLLETEEIDKPQDVTITAEYTEGENTEVAQKEVSVLAICPSGYALDFDGVDDYVEVDDAHSLDGMKALTLMAWVKTPGKTGTLDDNGFVINKYIHGGTKIDNSYDLGVNAAGDVRFQYNTGHEYVIKVSSGTVIDNLWHHIVGVYTGTEGSIYIDGVKVSLSRDDPDPGGPVNNTTELVLIGCVKSIFYDRTAFFDGLIDEVAIYNRALSAEEIWGLMHTRPEAGEPNLVAYWDFDEGEGQVAGDSAGDNDGTLGSTDGVDDSDPAWVDSVPPVGICMPVAVDIKPGSCPNPLNLASRGVLPAAVLGTEDFDVNTIDAASIFLEGVPAIRSSLEDVATALSDGNECECTTAGPDGYTDLTVKFNTQALVDELLKTEDGLVKDQMLPLTLRASLSDGTAIQGTDCVVLVGNVPRYLLVRGSDINGDGVVNLLDLAELAGYWLESSEAE